MLSFQLHPVGDCALLAEFAQRIAPDIGAAVAALNSRVLAAKLPGVVETVPAFASLLITYDPLVTEYDTIADAVKKLADADGADAAAGEGRLVTIPVCYGGNFGPDLPFVAQHAGLTEEEVIALHTGREYQIYMLGFLPGFPYLGGLDERLFTPRLGTPRTAIPAGAVGIGYARSRRMEAGEPRGDDRKDAVVYGDPNTFAFMIAAFALLAVFFDGPEQGSHLAVRMLLESAADLSLYFLLLLPALPLLRRRFSARLCATLWLVPTFIGACMNGLLNFRRVPSLVIPLREELLAALGWVWLAGFLLVFGGRVMGDRRFRGQLLSGAYPEEDPQVLALWQEALLAMDLPWEVRLLRARRPVPPLPPGGAEEICHRPAGAGLYGGGAALPLLP